MINCAIFGLRPGGKGVRVFQHRLRLSSLAIHGLSGRFCLFLTKWFDVRDHSPLWIGKLIALPFLIIYTNDVNAYCFREASERYNIPEKLLRAIARVESGMNPSAVNKNAGSEDIGLMQINSGWLPVLRRFGIGRNNLWNPCTNVHVGAWILAKNIETYGYTWEAVGAYNARSADKRIKYAKLILGELGKRG